MAKGCGLKHIRKGANLVRTKPEWIDEYLGLFEVKQPKKPKPESDVPSTIKKLKIL